MLPRNPDSLLDLSLLVIERPSIAPCAEDETLRLFDRCGPSLLRYVASFGLSPEESEDVVQEVFLALFRHLRLDRSRRNLKGWLFQVANNLALKQRKRIAKRAAAPWDEAAHGASDPAPNAEALLVERERRQLSSRCCRRCRCAIGAACCSAPKVSVIAISPRFSTCRSVASQSRSPVPSPGS
jgi:RNA polymerase sigma-70 factor, ECF subfamily